MSELTPTQEFNFIGMHFRTQDFIIAPLPKMLTKVQSIINHWCLADTVSALDLHKMLGTIQYMAPLVPRGCLRFRAIQWWASEAWDQQQKIGLRELPWQIGSFIIWPGGRLQQCVCVCGRPQYQWPVVQSSMSEPHQYYGNGSRLLCHPWFYQQVAWKGGPLDVWQRHSGVVYQTGKRNQVIQTDKIEDQTAQVLRSQGHSDCAGPSPGTLQHTGGQPVTTRTYTTHQMGDPSRPVTASVQPLGTAMDRSVCHIQQQEMPSFHMPISGLVGDLH